MPNIWSSFVAGGFSGQIRLDFILIILAMLTFTFVNMKITRRLWEQSKGKKVDFQKIINFSAVIFPAAFIFYAFFGLDYPVHVYGSFYVFNYAGGDLLAHSLNQAMLSRVFNFVNGGHTLVWVFILGAYFSVMFMEKRSGSQFWAGKALITGLGLIALSEFYWNTYYLVYLLFVTKSFESVTLGGFVISQLWLLTVILIWYWYYRKFFLKMLPIILPVESLYFAVWFLIGFPITLTSNATTNPNIITKWYSVVWVNEVEIFSWATISTITTIAYFLVKYQIGGKLEQRIAMIAEQKIRSMLFFFGRHY